MVVLTFPFAAPKLTRILTIKRSVQRAKCATAFAGRLRSQVPKVKEAKVKEAKAKEAKAKKAKAKEAKAKEAKEAMDEEMRFWPPI